MNQHSHHHIRRQSIIDWLSSLAQAQGYSAADARTRAEAQQDLDDALTGRQLTIPRRPDGIGMGARRLEPHLRRLHADA